MIPANDLQKFNPRGWDALKLAMGMVRMRLIALAYDALTASTEHSDVLLDLSATKQFATGALTTNRDVLIKARTLAAAGAMTITNAATVAIDKAPVAGANVTITFPYAFWVQASKARFDGQISSGLATGTAPLEVASTTAVTNLNADMVDGYHASDLTGAIGRQVYAFHDFFEKGASYAGTRNLSTVSGGNGGAIAQWVHVYSPMYVESLTLRQNATSGLRTAEWRLYKDTGSGTVAEVSGCNGTFSFTASAASNHNSTSASGTLIQPGTYWIVLRNTSTSNLFSIAQEGTDGIWSTKFAQYNAAVATLGATLDLVTSWTKYGEICAFRLNGRVLGATAIYD